VQSLKQNSRNSIISKMKQGPHLQCMALPAAVPAWYTCYIASKRARHFKDKTSSSLLEKCSMRSNTQAPLLTLTIEVAQHQLLQFQLLAL
jgi:hypothetical protein